MFIEKLNNTAEWDNFVEITPGGTFYHSTKWKKIIEKTFNERTNYLIIKDENGEIIGVFPSIIKKMGNLKIYSSLPYSDFGGPVIKQNKIEDTLNLIMEFLKVNSKNEHISLANINFEGSVLNKFLKSKYKFSNARVNRGTFEIDLDIKSSNSIWSKEFRKKDRNNIKRFYRDNFQVREASNKLDMYKFFKIYCSQTQYLNISSQPKELFENIWDLLYPENFNILLVEKEKTIGGVSFFKFGQSIYVTYVGMNRKELSGGYRIFPLLVWETIKWAEENGVRYVNLGATSSDSKNIHYKNKKIFGGTFYQQEEVFIHFNLRAWIYLQTMLKSIEMWKILREKMPIKITRIIEEKMRSSLMP